jgi:hypothetical protein
VRLPSTGTAVIGRIPDCEIVLNDPLVSRRHARLHVSAGRIAVEDLGSVNGVYVDGERIERLRLLSPRQRLMIGSQELQIDWSDDETPYSGERLGTQTLDGRPTITPSEPVNGEAANAEATTHGTFLEAVGDLVNRLLQHGDVASAERLVTGGLSNVLEAWRRGRGTDAELGARAAELAVRLASHTGNGSWLDYAFELYTLLGQLMPADLVNRLYTVIRGVERFDRRLLRAYVSAMTEARDGFGPAERFVLQRLQGLEQMTAS